jgi:hypothetical protein
MLQRTVCCAIVSGLTLAFGAGPASAADIPGNRSTKAVLKPGPRYSGSSDFRGDSDWYRVNLEAKTNYAFGIASDGACTELNLRDAAGKVLRTGGSCVSGTEGGFEFQTAAAGTYFVDAKDLDAGIQDGHGYPVLFSLSFRRDCRGDFLTACALQPGETRHSSLASAVDEDYYRVKLDSQRSYTIAFKAGGGKDLVLIDRDRHIFASPGTFVPQSGIKVPKSGTYFVDVSSFDDSGGTYTFRLTSP